MSFTLILSVLLVSTVTFGALAETGDYCGPGPGLAADPGNGGLIGERVTTVQANPATNPDFASLVAKGSKVKELSFTWLMHDEGQKDLTMKCILKGNLYRIEYLYSKELTIVEIGNDKTDVACQYCPATMTGWLLPEEDMEGYDAPRPATFWASADVSTGKYVREETMDGKKAYVFDYYDKADEATRVWIWADTGIPLKFSGKINGKEAAYTFTNVKVGGISDSVFKLPAGLTYKNI